LVDQARFAEAASTTATERKTAAEQQVREANRELEKAEAEHTAKEQEFAELSAKNVARDFHLSGAHATIAKALEPLGLAPVGAAVTALEGALNEARSVLDRGNKVLTPLVRAKDRAARWRSLIILVFGASAAAIACHWLLGWLGAAGIQQIAALSAGAASFITMGVRWLTAQTRWMSENLLVVERAQQ
jgi:hypothetical protein